MLVGVVMFVLALTILGLSLFSLSGYEAQFMSASYQRTQLFYDAMSGIDRTKTILATTGLLESAGSGLPLPGYPSIVFAQASQNGESTGVVQWTDPTKHITIRVRAERPGRPLENITIEAQFVPESDQSLYRDLIATSGRIEVYHDEDAYEYDNIYGNGTIRNSNYSDWGGQILGNPVHVESAAPLPNVQDFISEWPTVDTPAVAEGPGGTTRTYEFYLPLASDYRIFSGPQSVLNGFGLYETTADSIAFDLTGNIGTIVWLLPAGACFERWVRVIGPAESNLVIVAGKSTNTTYSAETGADLGLWFQGGIKSMGPNLFFVSDGTVALDRMRGTSHDYSIEFLAIFAGGVYLRGPLGAAGYIRRFEMSHPADDDAVLDPLYDANLLPNIRGRNKTFTLVPDSFMETADTNPPY